MDPSSGGLNLMSNMGLLYEHVREIAHVFLQEIIFDMEFAIVVTYVSCLGS